MLKVNIKFIAILLVSYICALIEGGSLFYGIFFSMVIILIFAVGSMLIYIKDIKSCIKCEKTVYFCEDLIKFNAEITNKGISFMPYLVLSADGKNPDSDLKSIAFCLKPKEVRNISYEMNFKKRGIYNFSPLNLYISDFFSVIKFKYQIKNETSVKVYPKIYKLDFESNKMAASSKYRVSGIKEDIYTFYDLRKYNSGDSLKRINWKVSAKYGELYVRNPDLICENHVCIILNMNKKDMTSGESYNIEEKLIDFLMSFLKITLRYGIKAKIYVDSLKNCSFEVSNMSGFNSLMEFFIKYESDGIVDFKRYSEEIIKNSLEKRSWIVLTDKSNSNFEKIHSEFEDGRHKIFLYGLQ